MELNKKRSVSSCRPEAPGVARCLGQGVHFLKLRARDGRDHELGDALAALDRDRLGAEVREDDADLAAVVAVDRAGPVQERRAPSSARARCASAPGPRSPRGWPPRSRSARGIGRRAAASSGAATAARRSHPAEPGVAYDGRSRPSPCGQDEDGKLEVRHRGVSNHTRGR